MDEGNNGKDELNLNDAKRKNTVPCFEPQRHDMCNTPQLYPQLAGPHLSSSGIMANVLPQVPGVLPSRMFYSYYPAPPYARNPYDSYPAYGTYEGKFRYFILLLNSAAESWK